MTWNNVYLGTPNPVGNYQGSAASTVLSDVSVSGSLDVNNIDVAGTATLSGALNSASAISGGAITGTTGAFTSLSETSLSLATLAGSGITVGGSTAAGFLFVTVGTSGLSVGVESGGSLYWINSTVSAA